MVQIQAEASTTKVLARRRLILKEASKCFREKGFHATGMRDIAAGLGMTVGNLYYYFHNKEAVLIFCQEETLRRLEELVAGVKGSVLRADAKLFQLILGHVLVLNEGTPGSLAHLEVPEGPEGSPLRMRRHNYEQALSKIIDAGIQDGTFRELDSRVAVLSVLGSVNWTVRWFRKDGPHTAHDIGVAFAEQIVRGLLADGIFLQHPATQVSPKNG